MIAPCGAMVAGMCAQAVGRPCLPSWLVSLRPSPAHGRLAICRWQDQTVHTAALHTHTQGSGNQASLQNKNSMTVSMTQADRRIITNLVRTIHLFLPRRSCHLACKAVLCLFTSSPSLNSICGQRSAVAVAAPVFLFMLRLPFAPHQEASQLGGVDPHSL